MEKFTPIHLIIIIGIVVLGLGFIFKGTGDPLSSTQFVTQSPSVTVMKPAKNPMVPNISNPGDTLPPPITRSENALVKVTLEAEQLVAELADGTTYEYWAFNKTVPGPFIRVMEGDTVEVSVTHTHNHVALNESEVPDSPPHSFTIDSFVHTANAAEMGEMGTMNASDAEHAAHMAAGHGEHSVDLHAVQGPMGGADGSRALPNATETFRFRADKAGLFLYHCGSPHVATHIANGMYGLILVEPKTGLAPVDKEFYIVEGELYTAGPLGQKGHQEFSKEKLLAEDPEYIVFNGKPGALTGDRALRAEVGDRVRLFVGASGQVNSNFHVIGEVFDKVYREGDLLSPPAQNVQTTVVPAGGAMMTEFTVDYPGTYVIVDHALSRAIDRGAAGHLIVTGEADPGLYSKIP